MKSIIIIFLSLVLVSFNENLRQQRNYKNDEISCAYETMNGNFDGQYVSYYKNGQIKATGEFKSNNRTGTWTIFDSTGRIRMQRVYTDPFTFKRLIPTVPDDKSIALFNVPKYTPSYNKEHYIDYFNIEERMVIWATLVMRFIPTDNNPLLFENNKLFTIIHENVLSNKVTVYENKNFSKIKSVPESINITTFNVIGFKLKEETIFDNERLISEKRIIGICPIAQNTYTFETYELYWVFFPDIRKYLAKENLDAAENPSYINTYDDIFFYRFFYSKIYTDIDNHKSPPTNKISDVDSVYAEMTEIGIIEQEHDTWISLTKQN